MRNWILLFLAFIVGAGLLACNSNETLLSQNPRPANQSAAASPPADNARRITAAELHQLWEKNEVTIIDTRPESAYKQEHIKGAILVPPGTLNAKFEQLPKGKMIAAYCT
jgi:3-mercaptopyruvate sulfurtransferase SseA